MNYYKIADVIISMEPDPHTAPQAEPYKITGEYVADFHVIPKTFEEYTSRTDLKMSFRSFQYLSCGQSFHTQLLDYNGTYIHASAVVVDDKAYLFSAPSGTGKSTHTALWLERFGDNAYILNDDKPVVRVLNDGIYVYGAPWSGKCDLSANKKVKLQGICFIERDSTDWIKPMDKNEATFKIYHASLRKLTQEQVIKEFSIINNIVNNIPIYRMGCTPTLNAVNVAYEGMRPK